MTTKPIAAPYLEAAAEGRLVLRVCDSCGTAQLPPRAVCENCGATAFTWRPAAGNATLASFTVVHRAPDDRAVPYIYALVELDEGPRIVSNLVDCAPADARIGMPLRVRFDADEPGGGSWPRFTPA